MPFLQNRDGDDILLELLGIFWDHENNSQLVSSVSFTHPFFKDSVLKVPCDSTVSDQFFRCEVKFMAFALSLSRLSQLPYGGRGLEED